MSLEIRRLEGETFVQAELLRERGRLTEAEFEALATGMLGGICDVLLAALGRGAAHGVLVLTNIAPSDALRALGHEDGGVLVLPNFGDGSLQLLLCRDRAAGRRA